MVRTVSHRPGKVTTAAGAVGVRVPRVNDERVDEAAGERKRSSSALLPPRCRKSLESSERLPLTERC